MATRGETFSQTMPSVAIAGATSGSFTVNPLLIGATTVSGNSGTIGVVPVDKGRVVKANTDDGATGREVLPVIVGQATITITAAGGTQVHYTLNGKNPTYRASKTSTENSTAINTRLNRTHMAAARVYSGAFTVDNGRPGDSVVVLRIRAYKTVSGPELGISPNEKSKVLIIKFVLKNTSW